MALANDEESADPVPEDAAVARRLTWFEVSAWLWLPVLVALLSLNTALFKDPGNAVATVFTTVGIVCLPFALICTAVWCRQGLRARKVKTSTSPRP
jgi:hypothetical protein